MSRKRSDIHIYHDLNGNSHSLSNHDLAVAVEIKAELVKANGKCNFHRLRRLMIANDIDKRAVKVCPGFKNLVKKYNYRYVINNDSRANSPQGSKDGPNKTIPYSVKNKIGNYNYAKRESQDMARNFNKLRRHITDTQILRDQIDHALQNATFNFKVDNNERIADTGDNVLLATFADLHVGALVNIPQNKFNLKVAKRRVSEYADKLLVIALKQDVSDVYIANIGDMVEQVYMRFTQGFDTEMNMSDQIVNAVDIVGGFLTFMYNHLSKSYITPELVVITID